MRSARRWRFCLLFTALAALILLAVRFPAAALDDLVITEFMAQNTTSLADEDGDFSDWIEIYNAGTNGVNLNGWYLTDKPSDNVASWWRFPATNLAINSYLVIFASEKNRRTPGRPLHTNFRLSNTGEPIALVKPDGLTVQASIATYPRQVPGISYGVPTTLISAMPIAEGSLVKLTVPADDSMGLAWTGIGFNDASWISATNGVGFESDPLLVAGPPELIAQSVLDFGVGGIQGTNSWFYGYWNKTSDADGIYEASDFTAFPRGTGTGLNSTNFFTGVKWDWPPGAGPPFTEISTNSMHPSGDNGNITLETHWAIRRYIVETNGPLRLTGILAVNGTNGTCGDGVVAHIIVDGVDVWQRASFHSSESYSIVVAANVGSTIDFAVDPGPAGNDACDLTVFTAFVRTAGPNVVVADTIADWTATGSQGENNWTYGYYNRATDAGGIYAAADFRPFPSGSGPHSAANFWNGSAWQWFDGDPPFDTIGETLTRPSILETGGVKGQEHWVIRRWVSEVSGPIVIDWHAAKKQPGLISGGVTCSLYQNGTQRDTFNLSGSDFVGLLRQTNFTVQVGDLIDFTMSPRGDVDDDICMLNATIHGQTSLSNRFVSDVGALITNINPSVYVRLPFTLTDPASINGLTLQLKYDDGFVAYLNGVQVAAANAPAALLWNSAATQARSDVEAAQYRDFDLADVSDLLTAGENVLAIQGLNSSVNDADLLLSAQLIVTQPELNRIAPRYFASPSPGTFNGVGTTNLGPLITGFQHLPAQPDDAENLVVTTRVSPTINALSSVRLYYRIMYGSESNVVMLDDGLHGDGTPGDGVFGAIIPHTVYTNGQMVRYYFTAADSFNNLSRQPPLGDTNNSSLYFGTVVRDPSLTNALPVLQWFVPPNQGAVLDGGSAVRCALYWKGEFYDNLRFTLHGQSSRGFRKKSYNVDFNPDHNFNWADGERRVDDINLLNTYTDKSHMRNILGYETHRDAGNRSPYHFVVPVRMQSNAVFYGIAHIVENGDGNYIRRIGRDPNGALYKMYDTMASVDSAEKKTRRFESKLDLQELISRSANRQWIYDNVDISEVIDFLAAMIVTGNIDCCHKNYYVYRDSEGDREWEMLPWDVDLSFGRNWSGSESYYDDRVYPENGLFVGGNATLPTTLFAANSATRKMYLRRVRTLMDTLQQTNGTPASELKYERRIDELTAQFAPDAAMDLTKWGTWGGGAQDIFNQTSPYYRTLPQSVQELKNDYMPRRRTFVFDKKMNQPAEFPNAQPADATILIAAIEYNPTSGNQNEEYIQLTNTNLYAVDISGWQLSGAVSHTFQGGVVLVATSSVYVAANKLAFRGRATPPRGGLQLYVEGPYEGQLSARGETIVLSDTTGRTVDTKVYQGNPSGAQQYLRVTEIMYHPPWQPPGSLYDAEDLEYIELRNTAPTNLNLAGVRFSGGIEFTFPDISLAPGAYTLVVRNSAAFIARYGNSLPIAGTYAGSLDNGGENVRLDDAVGEKILDFRYENTWYPITDGPGASLVIVDDTADWRTWELKESWRASAVDIGSPGQTDGTPVSVPLVLVNEVLTRSEPPLVDAIELYNPNAATVDISGWFLSDDLDQPKKFVMPTGTTIPGGGYAVFYETNSFGVGPNAFQLSSSGDETYLFSGNGTQLTGYLDGWGYDAAEGGVSFGRYVNSQNHAHFVAQNALSLGVTNTQPKVGPIVLSEINYHPLETGIATQNEEYVELANISGADVQLFDPAQPENTWHLRSGVDFDFPPDVTLPAGGHLIVVGFNPAEAGRLATFRARYSIPDNVVVVGPFIGQLANSGETIKLSRPGAPDAGDVPYILVDQVDYLEQAPWPSATNGLTLQRVSESAYGNDPVNWTAVGPSGGIPYQPGGNPPIFTRQPTNTAGVLGQSIQISAEVSGTPPLFYQWRWNGLNIPGANQATFTLQPIEARDAGTYSLVVLNSAGRAESGPAVLTVLSPVSIAVQPQSVTLRGSTNNANFGYTTNNAIFRVVANLQRPTTYEWRRNGVPVHLGFAPDLYVQDAGLEHDGIYQVIVSDAISRATSNPVRLTVLVTPTMLIPPQNQSVVVNGSFTASAVVRGNPPPFRFEWREMSSALGNIRKNESTNSATNFLTFGPITNLTNRAWRLRVFNDAATTGGPTNEFIVVAATDGDGDGIPDEWETRYGFRPDSNTDRHLDPDGDGLSNLAEYIAGTDPTNPQSFLKVEAQVAGEQATVRFGAVANRTYSLRYTDVLGTGPWTKLASVPARGQDRIESFVDPTWTTNRFYQVVSPGP